MEWIDTLAWCTSQRDHLNSFCWHVTTLALWRIMVALIRLHMLDVLAERTVSSFSTWWMQLVVRSAEPQGLHRCCSRCSLTWCDQRRLPMLALQTAGTIPVVLFGTAKSSLAFSVRENPSENGRHYQRPCGRLWICLLPVLHVHPMLQLMGYNRLYIYYMWLIVIIVVNIYIYVWLYIILYIYG